MDGLNFSPRNMQQLVNNALKDATSLVVVTQDGGSLEARAPVELGTDGMAFKPDNGTVIVPYTSIQRLIIG